MFRECSAFLGAQEYGVGRPGNFHRLAEQVSIERDMECLVFSVNPLTLRPQYSGGLSDKMTI